MNKLFILFLGFSAITILCETNDEIDKYDNYIIAFEDLHIEK